MMALVWTLAKALLLILPDVWNEVKTGRIRASSRREVLSALTLEHIRRVKRARKAREAADTPTDDKFDRSK